MPRHPRRRRRPAAAGLRPLTAGERARVQEVLEKLDALIRLVGDAPEGCFAETSREEMSAMLANDRPKLTEVIADGAALAPDELEAKLKLAEGAFGVVLASLMLGMA